MTHSNQAPIASMTSARNEPTRDAHSHKRKVTFVFYCAPLDDKNPLFNELYKGATAKELRGVTDSASYLTHLPYVVVDADSKQVIYPFGNKKDEIALFPPKVASTQLQDGNRWTHTLPAIDIPENVTRIALHIANDADVQHRNFQLFPWKVPNAAQSKVHVYELRSDLQEKFADKNQLGDSPGENVLASKPGVDSEYYGYLTGDIWLQVSHEFTDQDIVQLCPPETLSRSALHAHQSNSPNNSGANRPPLAPDSTFGRQSNLQGSMGSVPGPLSGMPTATPQAPSTDVSTTKLSVDWHAILLPIYSAGVNSRSMSSFSVQIADLGITVNFASRAVANAVNTSNRTTVQQALRRTSPRVFAAVLKAAWHLRIDTLDLSSSWRPMLGSILHKMGVGLDVSHFDDGAEDIHFVIRNRGKADRKKPFPSTAGGQKLASLYAELNKEGEVASNQVYTPWVNWVEPHDTHMHITAKAN